MDFSEQYPELAATGVKSPGEATCRHKCCAWMFRALKAKFCQAHRPGLLDRAVRRFDERHCLKVIRCG